MRKFNITVNGATYQVEIEEVGAFAAPAPQAVPQVAAAPAPQATPVQAAAPAPAPAPATPAAPVAGGQQIKCPMPGTILDIRAAEGASVKKGDILIILEAMKMENEILSPADGVVAQIAVQRGASVNSGDLLAVIK
ncbi:MAG: biotin/lipoyl-binding protein [Clostridiales bacterium]|nr:biotin/lipoyl-binding protein [Clostridiales bacterium]